MDKSLNTKVSSSLQMSAFWERGRIKSDLVSGVMTFQGNNFLFIDDSGQEQLRISLSEIKKTRLSFAKSLKPVGITVYPRQPARGMRFSYGYKKKSERVGGNLSFYDWRDNFTKAGIPSGSHKTDMITHGISLLLAVLAAIVFALFIFQAQNAR